MVTEGPVVSLAQLSVQSSYGRDVLGISKRE